MSKTWWNDSVSKTTQGRGIFSQANHDQIKEWELRNRCVRGRRAAAATCTHATATATDTAVTIVLQDKVPIPG